MYTPTDSSVVNLIKFGLAGLTAPVSTVLQEEFFGSDIYKHWPKAGSLVSKAFAAIIIFSYRLQTRGR